MMVRRIARYVREIVLAENWALIQCVLRALEIPVQPSEAEQVVLAGVETH